MRKEEVFYVTLNVEDPILFAEDLSTNIRFMLDRLYLRKFYQNYFIYEVKSFESSGRCIIQSTNLSGCGYIDVRFIAVVNTYYVEDIIGPVEIIHTDNMIICQTVHDDMPIYGKLQKNDISVVFQLKQKIPTEIVKLETRSMSECAWACLDPLLPKCRILHYKITGKIEKNIEIQMLQTTLRETLDKREKILKSHKNELFFFEEKYYTYKKSKCNEKSTIYYKDSVWPNVIKKPFKSINLLKMDDFKSLQSIVYKPLEVHPGMPVIATTNDKCDSFVEIDVNLVLVRLIQQAIDYNKLFIKMVDEYSANEIKSHKNLWLILENKQL